MGELAARRICGGTPLISLRAERPTIGDLVAILDTSGTRGKCRHLIGRSVKITTDDHSKCPYKVAGCDYWLVVEDVEKQDNINTQAPLSQQPGEPVLGATAGAV